MSTWMRGMDVPTEYHISKTKAYSLLREFRCQTDPKDYIVDGRILLIKKEEFEDWWRNRRKEAM